VLGAGSDAVVEALGTAGGLADLVTTTITRNLASYANVERLTLLGSGVINGTGNALANTITGNAVANILDGGVDAFVDSLIGGGGNDTYVLGAGSDVVTELAGAAGGLADTVTSTITRSLVSYANVEKLTLLGINTANGTGNGLADVITGNSAANILDGGVDAVVDTLIGGGGNDTYVLGAGSDLIVEAAGAAGGASDTVTSTISLSMHIEAPFNGIERLVLLGDGNLDGTGNGLNNSITGNSGHNALFGFGGDDNLTGNDGNDYLNGMAGNDTLNGGTGIDHFVFDTILNEKTNLDTVKEFNVLEDIIELDRFIFLNVKFDDKGNVEQSSFVFSKEALDDNDYLLYNESSGQLLFDADANGSGLAIVFAQVEPGLAGLTYLNFHIMPLVA
jgi:Ca2+-binding RTX toxin-like protein